MGSWVEQVVPRIANAALGTAAVRAVRARVCAGLTGEVLKVGFGSGLNVPHYPDGVVRVAAVEPCDLGWRLAGERLAASRVPVQRSGLDGQAMPFPDACFDSALSTSSSTGARRTPPCSAGSAGSSRCRSASRAAAT